MNANRRGAETLLDGLDDAQREAVVTPAVPLCIVAGAGTGKTRTITHRVAYQVLSGEFAANQTLAITHTGKAAGELRERLANLGVYRVQARTFHAAALGQLKQFWSATGIETPEPVVLANRVPQLAKAIAKGGGRPTSEALQTVGDEITWARARQVRPRDYMSRARDVGREPDLPLHTIASAYHAYERAKRTAKVVDFDDVISLLTDLIERDEQVATSLRTSFANFVVDEYQDTDASQQALLDAWLGGRPAITAVGDPAQTIYSFKGADPKILLSFTERYPDARKVELTTNYRSTPNVLNAANRLSARLTGSVRLHTSNAPGPPPALVSYYNDASEAEGIAKMVQSAITSGAEPSDIAVLHPFNSQAPAIRSELVALGIPVSVRPEEEFFSRAEVASVMAALIEHVARRPDADGVPIVLELLQDAGFDENSAPVAVGAKRERWEFQKSLLDQARRLSDAGHQSLAKLYSELEHLREAEHVPSGTDGVNVTTIHKAKGLEWDTVIVAKTTQGSLPSSFAKTIPEIEEQRRLAYVATTRARKSLTWTWAETWTSPKGYLRDNKPSQFHNDIAEPTLAPDPDQPAAGTKPRKEEASTPSTASVIRDISESIWGPRKV